MEEFKGTAGPWFWDDEGLGNTSRLVFGRDYPLEMTSKADRALITAAPDLLVALQKIRDYAEDVCGVCPDDCHEEHPLMLASSAIAKALGK